MKITSVLSKRASNDKVYSDLIYEWEDDYSNALGVPIKSYSSLRERFQNKVFGFIHKVKLESFAQKLDGVFGRKSGKTLVFTLYPYTRFSLYTTADKIPFIIDFDHGVNLETFYRVYKNCEVVIISSRVAYEYLVKQGCPLNIKHVPLSIKSDLKVNRIDIKDRKYDIFIARQNPVLMEYLNQYEAKHPAVHYIVRKWEKGKLYSGNAYFSNKEGRLGEFSNREAYFDLLANSKVAFYSTTGSDMPNTRFMNHVTPALLEYLTAGCQVMIRWYDTPDSDFFNLPQYFENASSYDVFERLLDNYLSTEQNPFARNDDFLQKYGFNSQFRIFKNQLSL